MTTYPRITINGTDYTDATTTPISKTMTSSSQSCTITLPNTNGKYKTTFSIGNAVTVRLGGTNPPTTKVFSGEIDEVQFQGDPNTDYIVLTCRDLMARLQRTTILEVYASQTGDAIVKNIIDRYITGITYVNVQAQTKVVTSIRFKRVSAFDAIKQIAEFCGADFWIDEDNDLHFQKSTSVDSGFTANNANIKYSEFRTTRDEMYNRILVYGGMGLTGYQETQTADGAGSVFTLGTRPVLVEVRNAGTFQTGAQFDALAGSYPAGITYLWDYDNSNIIFLSPPTSGNSIIVNYKAERPIIKVARDLASIGSYAQKELLVDDRQITDPLHAREIAKSELALRKDPKQIGTIRVDTATLFTPGHLITVDLPNMGIDSKKFRISEVIYNITPENLNRDDVVTLRLAETTFATFSEPKDITVVLKNMYADIRRLQAEDASTTEVTTQLLQFVQTGSPSVRAWYIRSQAINDSFIIGRSLIGSSTVYTSTDNFDYNTFIDNNLSTANNQLTFNT